MQSQVLEGRNFALVLEVLRFVIYEIYDLQIHNLRIYV